MRVVLDNNVFISAIFWKGVPHKIIKLAEQDKVKIYATLEILEELFGVLRRRKFDHLFKEAETSREKVFQKVARLSQICAPGIKVKVIKDDTSDNKFLSCALSCGADFIISGDKHLLALKNFQGILVLTPKEFIECFKGSKNDKTNK